MKGMEQVLVLFLLILAGIAVKKAKIVTDHIHDEISSLVIHICLPAFILSAMEFDFSPQVIMNSGVLVLLSFAVYILSIFLGSLLVKVLGKTGTQKDIYQYISVFSNSSFMGYPIVGMAFGKEAVFYAAIYNLSFSVLVWSYGVYVMNRSHNQGKEISKKEAFISGLKGSVNPSMVAVFMGFSLFLLGIKLPRPLFHAIEMIGKSTTPLSMMFIGFILADVHPRELFEDKKDFVLAFHRLIFLPLLIYGVLKGFGASGIVLVIPVMITAMPAAANSAIIASKYKSDFRLASKLIFVTTFLSILTIPLVIALVQ